MKAPPPVVAVIGAGTMGHGIAYVAALSGCDVRLTDDRAAALLQAKAKIEDLLASGLKRGKLTESDAAAVRKRLGTDATVRNAITDADGLTVFDAPDRPFTHELALAFGDAIGKNIYLALSGGELHFGRLPARRFLASPPWLPTLVFGVDAVRSVRRGGIGGGSWVVAWRCGFVLCQPLPEALIVRLQTLQGLPLPIDDIEQPFDGDFSAEGIAPQLLRIEDERNIHAHHHGPRAEGLTRKVVEKLRAPSFRCGADHVE